MLIKLSKLYSLIQDMNFKVLAGKDGMDRPVRWVQMVESAEIATFLAGDEVVITTGIALKTEEELLELIRVSYKNNASGIIINIGPFIEKVSSEIINFCDKHDFTLLEAPWEAHMAELMRRFCVELTEQNKKVIQLSDAMKSAIFCPDQPELYLNCLEQNEYMYEWRYCVSCLKIYDINNKGLNSDRIRAIIGRLEYIISQRNWKAVVMKVDKKIIFVFANQEEISIKLKLKVLIESFNDLIEESENYYVSVGRVAAGISEIKKSYVDSEKMIKWQKNNNRNKEVCMYKELGMYKLIMAINDDEVLKEYYDETILLLQEYDKLNDTDYMITLATYLRHNGSIKNAALELYIHKNTISYKLKKIEAILGVSLCEFEVRQNLNIALIIGELIK